jgi:putative GTP pyrophosphokinase
LKGLLIELQYRTLIQHAWATTVEVIGFITKSQPKFERGDPRFTEAMAYASEILARAFEEIKGPFPDMADRAVVAAFRRLDKDLRLLQMLRGVKAADTTIASGGNAILIFREDGALEIRSYTSAPVALEDLFRLEQEYNEDDIVLVRADTSEDVRLAFKNYFSDTSDFIRLIEKGCQVLSPPRIRRRRIK